MSTQEIAPWENTAVADGENTDLQNNISTDIAGDAAGTDDPQDSEIDETDRSEDAAADESEEVAGPAVGDESEAEEVPPEKIPLIDEIATEFVGFWNRLVSQTNWEKGKVIYTWRTRLMEAGLPRSIYSDESISRRIGNVSSQHVGRLRRVYEQFGQSEIYPNLYWSHYQAALDWDDADDWLSLASRDSMSVAAMRIARWEKYASPEDRKPKESEIISSEPDEDVNPFNDSDAGFIDGPGNVEEGDESGKGKRGKKSDSDPDSETGEIHNPDDDSSSKNHSKPGQTSLEAEDGPWQSTSQTTGDIINAINKLDPLPEDLTDAFEQLKIAIINHKLTKWSETDPELLMTYLAAMRGLVIARE